MPTKSRQFNDNVPNLIAVGPVTYHTTDEDIKTRIQIALSQNCGVELSNIQIRVCEGAVSIDGVVTASQLTQITQEIENCGVHEIENMLRIE